MAYLSDISGAFDKVFKDYMMAKLAFALFADDLNAFKSIPLSVSNVDTIAAM